MVFVVGPVRRALYALALAAGVAGSGCALYGSGDDDGAVVECDDNGGYMAPAQTTRNPATGSCEAPGVGTSCDPGPVLPGGPGGDGEAPDRVPPNDWGACSSYCDGLDELTCVVSDGCRAVYVAYPTDGPSGGVRAYAACWAVAPSGPSRGGICEGLDAYGCSVHDDCSVVHDNIAGIPGPFRSCVDETMCGSAPGGEPVPPVEYRNPDTGTCEYGGGGGGVDPCVNLGGEGNGGIAPVADWGVCGSPCEGYDEPSCRVADGCRAIYASTCLPDEPCEPPFAACWPIAPSGPGIAVADGCSALTAYECSRHQDCVAVHDGSAGTPGGFLACRTE